MIQAASLTGWQSLDESRAEQQWDSMLKQFSDKNIFQSYLWGEIKRKSGWTPHYWVAYGDDEQPLAMMQGVVKIKMGAAIVQAFGGPVGDLDRCGVDLQQEILRTLDINRCYCRVNLHRAYSNRDVLSLRSGGWHRMIYSNPMHSGLSMTLDLRHGVDSIVAGFARRWRNNVKRAKKMTLAVEQWENPDPSEMHDLFRKFESFKGISEQFSADELEHLLTIFKDQLLLLRCRDEAGDVCCFRGALVFDSYAIDMFAVTLENGRKNSSSYATFLGLLDALSLARVQFYDLNGIDPIQNPGVTEFKRGTGAEVLEYLGSWEWATSQNLRRVLNFAKYSKDNYGSLGKRLRWRSVR